MYINRSAYLTTTKSTTPSTAAASKPLSDRLSDYPAAGVDLANIVSYPPQLEPLPVKPLFLDVAWNYIRYPGQAEPAAVAAVEARPQAAGASAAAAGAGAAEPEAKPQQKRGWFGFGR